MNKKFPLAIFAACFLSSADATSWPNYVYFDIAGMKEFSFTETGHSISPGQAYGPVASGVKKENGQDQGYILINAGRHKTDATAAWFKSQAGTGQTLACDSSSTYPNQLNFAVQGTLKITTLTNKVYSCEKFTVAQGNFNETNNWWLASPTMFGVHISITGLTAQWCTSSNASIPALVIFSPKTPCTNHFNAAIIPLTGVP